jgi:oligopeptide/dipeptide ABC transporter ATP-binding protein
MSARDEVGKPSGQPGSGRIHEMAPDAAPSRVLLDVHDLTVQYRGGPSPALTGVGFSITEGERVGIVGESGSGKTTLALAVSRLLPGSARITAGQVMLRGTDMSSLSGEALRKLHGNTIGRVPQDSLAGLNPVISVGKQLRDAIRAHRRLSRDAEHAEIANLLRQMNMPDIEMKLRSYPHELSGGMRQRVLIAMALINKPALVVADEPTTALDATVQAQLLEVFQNLTTAQGSALLLVSHDISVVSAVCERMIVMYGGEIVEDGPTAEIMDSPRHPYTAALIAARMTRTVHSQAGERGRPVPRAAADGCRYADRCEFRFDACREHPDLAPAQARHRVRCFYRQGAPGGADHGLDEASAARSTRP